MSELVGGLADKIYTVLLLGVATIALVVPSSDVAFSQGGAGSQAPLYIAIDLHPSGFGSSEADGVSSGQQVGVGYPAGLRHALLWRGSAASMVDLDASGGIEATAVCRGQQVGFGSGPGMRGYPHALLWQGSAASVVDLNPRGYDGSEAFGTSDADQVGWGYPTVGGGQHALLWHGSAASVVDLNPRGFISSEAHGTSGAEQVGWGSVGTTSGSHALLWRGNAASVVDLNPRGFDASEAHGTAGGQQVGWGGSFPWHALLWRGSAKSVVDLNPGGGNHFSQAYSTNGMEQVGVADGHAVMWRGSVDSMVDLHAFLPSSFESSIAFGIDAAGNIVGVASGPEHWSPSHAILWKRNVPKLGTSQGRTTGC